MNTPRLLDNDIRHAERRHPVDFLEPLSPESEIVHRTCEVLSRTFGWVADGRTAEQRGLRASVVLYCVRADLIDAATVEELGAQVGCAARNVEILVADFCRTIGWK